MPTSHILWVLDITDPQQWGSGLFIIGTINYELLDSIIF